MGPRAEGRQRSPQHQTRGEASPGGSTGRGRLISDLGPPDGESTCLCCVKPLSRASVPAAPGATRTRGGGRPQVSPQPRAVGAHVEHSAKATSGSRGRFARRGVLRADRARSHTGPATCLRCNPSANTPARRVQAPGHPRPQPSPGAGTALTPAATDGGDPAGSASQEHPRCRSLTGSRQTHMGTETPAPTGATHRHRVRPAETPRCAGVRGASWWEGGRRQGCLVKAGVAAQTEASRVVGLGTHGSGRRGTA